MEEVEEEEYVMMHDEEEEEMHELIHALGTIPEVTERKETEQRARAGCHVEDRDLNRIDCCMLNCSECE